MNHLVQKAVVGAVAALAMAITVSPAHADPGFAPAPTDIVGVGSDTTQDYVNALAKAYNSKTPSPAAKLASWDATPKGSTITPKSGCTPIQRPDGSSAGIKALLNDTSGCLDFARSSRAKKPDGSENALAFFAFGRDGVTWASQARTNAPQNLTKTQLSRIYRCSPQARTWNQVRGRTTQQIRPYLPQVGSGTRAFFLGAIGLTDAQVGSCVNQTIQENDGKALPNNANVIEPYSIAKFIAQRYRHHNDRSGTVALHQIAGVTPIVGTKPVDKRINSAFPADFLRLVFNVVKKNNDGTVAPKYTGVFAKGGFACSKPAIVADYGFLALGAGCGAQS
jgi:ABC-type phosphate transport system substrate-binding protein